MVDDAEVVCVQQYNAKGHWNEIRVQWMLNKTHLLKQCQNKSICRTKQKCLEASSQRFVSSETVLVHKV
jgi:hypothetical protein